MRKAQWLIYSVMALLLCWPGPSLAEDWVDVDIGETVVRWTVQGEFEQVILTVVLPNSKVIRREIKGGEPVVFEVDRSAKDGTYKYEVRGIQRFDESVRKELEAARRSGDEFDVIESLKDAGRLPRDPAVRSGAFSVKDGVLVRPDLREDDDEGAQRTATAPRETTGKRQTTGNGIGIITAADQVIPDDLIVQGSECVGFDCVNNENFGFDTIRLKENNLRIHFDDTSTLAGFPANDWRLIANDSAGGGQSKLSIEDSTGARTPFTVEAGATTNSIYVDSTGRVGFRTSTPVLDLHINTSNTPAIRLEQNNSGGFTAQTWDIGANEANFFVRDVTGGSKLSFRIRPGAPTGSLDISSDGDVGIGTGSPSSKLHVTNSDGTTKLLVAETSGTTSPREIAEFRNNGGAIVIYEDTSVTPRWSTGTSGTSFVWDNQGNAGVEFSLSQTGAAVFLGTVTPGSSRTIKQDFLAVNPRELLRKVLDLPITSWNYKRDPNERHIGPMSEDFHAAFAVGGDKGISVTDSAGVALAAIQGLNQVVEEKDAEIAELKQRNDDLAQRLAALEALVSSLAGAPK
jgi:hypothetical protein